MPELNPSSLLQRLLSLPQEILLQILINLNPQWLKMLRLLDRRIPTVATEALFTNLTLMYPEGRACDIIEDMSPDITHLIQNLTFTSTEPRSDPKIKAPYLCYEIYKVCCYPNVHMLSFEGDWGCFQGCMEDYLGEIPFPFVKTISFMTQKLEITHPDDEDNIDVTMSLREAFKRYQDTYYCSDDDNSGDLSFRIRSQGQVPLFFQGSQFHTLRNLTIYDVSPDLEDMLDVIQGGGHLRKIELINASLVGRQTSYHGEDIIRPFSRVIQVLRRRYCSMQKRKLSRLEYSLQDVSKVNWEGSFSATQDELEQWFNMDINSVRGSSFLKNKLGHIRLRPEEFEVIHTNDPSVIDSRIKEHQDVEGLLEFVAEVATDIGPQKV